jgi:hypothetical protein
VLAKKLAPAVGSLPSVRPFFVVFASLSVFRPLVRSPPKHSHPTVFLILFLLTFLFFSMFST